MLQRHVYLCIFVFSNCLRISNVNMYFQEVKSTAHPPIIGALGHSGLAEKHDYHNHDDLRQCIAIANFKTIPIQFSTQLKKKYSRGM